MTFRQTPNGDFAVGLDVGTTKICAIAGKWEMGRMKVISVGSSPSHGLRKGIVVDRELTADSIKRSLKNVESAMGVEIKSVFVGIAGGHIKGFNGYGAIGVKGMVKEEDVERLMDSASAVCVPVDREILHVIPAGFRLDRDNGIENPVGLSGERLEARVHIVTGSVTSVQNLIKCCEAAEVEVNDIVLEPLASADAVLTDHERERGVALVDIGGGTTDIAVYKDGIVRHTAVLALGGNHITNDIAIGLGIPAEEAERVKKTYGYAVAGMIDERGDMDIKGEEGQIKKVPRRYLTGIIEPRCEELMTLVKKEIDTVLRGLKDGTPFPPRFSGVVLTGGTSLLKAIDISAKLVLRLPVRIGIPKGIVNNDLVNSPEYATGVGLVHYGLEHQGKQDDVWTDKPLTSGGIFERMKYWVKGYF